MEINTKDCYCKELILSEKHKLLLKRNDFDDLGSILQIEFPQEYIKDFSLSFIFYDLNRNIITPNNLFLLTKEKNLSFDKSLFIFPKSYKTNFSQSSNSILQPSTNLFSNNYLNNKDEDNNISLKLKFLNKEISYFKLLMIKKNYYIYNTTNNNDNSNQLNKMLKLSKAINNNIKVGDLTNANLIQENFQEENDFIIYNIDCINMDFIDKDLELKITNYNSNPNPNHKENKNKRFLFINEPKEEDCTFNEIIYNQKIPKDSNNDNYVKKDQINLILEELNKVNLSLIAEKENVEKQKKDIKAREDNLNILIL